MEKKNFFKTKEGGLTIAFLVIIAAFIFMLLGLSMRSNMACAIGFIFMTAAMLYSPFKVYVLDRRKKN